MEMLFQLRYPLFNGRSGHGSIRHCVCSKLFLHGLAKLLLQVGFQGSQLGACEGSLGDGRHVRLDLSMELWSHGSVSLVSLVSKLSRVSLDAMMVKPWLGSASLEGQLRNEDIRMSHAINPVCGIFNCLDGPNNSGGVWCSSSWLQRSGIPQLFRILAMASFVLENGKGPNV